MLSDLFVLEQACDLDHFDYYNFFKDGIALSQCIHGSLKLKQPLLQAVKMPTPIRCDILTGLEFQN